MVWGGYFEICYIDIRVFNPLATSNSGPNLLSTYRKHESLKNEDFKLLKLLSEKWMSRLG